MKILVESTDLTQEFLIDLYAKKVRISDAVKSPNGWLSLTLEGSEINLLRVYLKHWCEPALYEYVEDFKHCIIQD